MIRAHISLVLIQENDYTNWRDPYTRDRCCVVPDDQYLEEIFLQGVCSLHKIQHLASYGPILTKYTRKHVKVQYTNLKTNHIQSIQEQDHINERSNQTSQPTNFTTNNTNCAVRGLFFGGLYFFHGDHALEHDTTSTRNQPKIRPSGMATAGSTRQWILFHHPTTHICHI